LCTRRFYCRQRACRRKIFSERFPHLTVAYGRHTDRQRQVLKRIGYALGGEAGFRLASQLAIDGSADTILRVLKRDSPPGDDQSISALGVDDWAWRRGQRYGTILVDLERRRPIDLLPDRESETLEKWLEAHPGVKIISRDRAGAYAEGARKGAPEAVQVADRFHILCNLTQALQRLLERLSISLRKIHPESAPAEASPTEAHAAATPGDAITTEPVSAPVTVYRYQQESQQRRERRKARFEAVRDAFQRG
jgi:transposase